MAKKTILLSSIIFLIAAFLNTTITQSQTIPEPAKPPFIQIAILLDTSNSMDGLINQAKTQLWSIVNEFATTKKNNRIPELQVALYEYGNDSLSKSSGYIRLILPLTTDLDRVSEELFALKTNGGSEYCGQVINHAVNSLQWSQNTDDYKAVFIAGNEPFNQGPFDYRDACKSAIAKGIIINTIHCGSYIKGRTGKWQDGALLADGSYLHIEQNRNAVHIEAPQDKEIARLGAELNTTYISFGKMGFAGAARQAEQDSNAAMAPASEVARAVSKSSAHYRNAKWDLVDAAKNDNFKVEGISTEELPDVMKTMTDEQRKQYIDKKSKQREDIQQKIRQLNAQRQQYITEQMKKLADKDQNTLEHVMITTLRSQAEQKHFTFPTADNQNNNIQ